MNSLLSKLARAMESKSSSLRYLRATFGRSVRLIPVEEVLFIQARSKYTSVVTGEGEFLMRMSLSELAKRLDPEQFWQIHRSVIVNASKVVAVHQTGREVYALTVRGSEEHLPVSRSFIHLFKQM